MSKPHVFLSYDFEMDAPRAALLTRLGLVSAPMPESPSDWNAIERSEARYRQWVDAGMADKDAVVVLVGARTATRPRVLYEIERAAELGKAILGVRIHMLVPQGMQLGARGLDPFSRVKLADAVGHPFRPNLYEPSATDAQGDIRRQFTHWLTLAWHAQALRERRFEERLMARVKAAREQGARRPQGSAITEPVAFPAPRVRTQ